MNIAQSKTRKATTGAVTLRVVAFALASAAASSRFAPFGRPFALATAAASSRLAPFGRPFALATAAAFACLVGLYCAAALPALASTTKSCEAEANKFLMNAQFGDAQRACSKGIKENPSDKLVFLNKIAEMGAIRPEAVKGLDASREAVHLAPKNAQVLATNAINEFLGGFVVKSAQMAQQALTVDPNNGRAHAALALTGLRDESIPRDQELAKATKLAPKDLVIMAVAAEIHLRKLEYDLAEKNFSSMVKAFPNTGLPLYLRGFFRREVFNNAGAIKDLTEYCKYNNKDNFVVTSLAKLNKKVGHYKEAIDNFNQLEKMGGAGFSCYSRRAECYEMVHNDDMAMKDYKRALEECGVNKPGFLNKYASTYGQTRRSAWTKMMDPKDISDFSANKAMWLKLIRLEQKRGEYDAALNDLKNFAQVFPGDLNSIYARHKLYKKTGKWTSALADINLLISRNPTVSEYYTSRAEVYKAMKQPERAAEDLKRVHNLDTTGTVDGE